jgi:hypothetical protein
VGGQKCKKIEEQKTKLPLVLYEIFYATFPEKNPKNESGKSLR